MYPKGNLTIPASHGHLEAILKEPAGERRGVGLVCHPHPLGGGTMHNKVVFRAAAGLIDAGLTTLRFNFRGVGSSTGEHNEIEGGVEDVRDALEYMAGEYAGEDITLAGFSFGSRTGMAVGVDDPRVKRLVSIGTPVEKYRDYDFLVSVGKPILFVHGDQDEFCSVESLRSLTDRIAHAEVVIFENCGHFFDEHLNELRDVVSTWISKCFDVAHTVVASLLSDFDPSDLSIVTNESSIADNGERFAAVYNLKLDAITFVGTTEEKQLLKAGVQVIDSLPEA